MLRLAPILVVALLLTACGSDGGGDAPPPSPTRPYYGPTDIGAGTPSPPASTTATVTSLADAGAGSLRQTLSEVGPDATIGFDASLSNGRVQLTSTITLSKDVTLNAAAAPGLTIDGGGARRLVQVQTGVDAEFVGLAFTGGRAVNGSNSPGGAINTGNDATLTLRHCTFTNNVADIGGAVRAGYDTDTLIEDCTFINNDGGGARNGFSAGAVSTNGHGVLTVRRSWFEGNTGHSGGAVYNLLQPLEIEDCVFLSNSSSGPGAAVFTDEGNWVGPSATVGGSIAVRRCWLENNHGKEVGGALFLWANKLDTVLVEDCVLFDNSVRNDGTSSAAKGGGLRTRGILTVRRCSFVKNLAEQQGGGMWIDGAGPFLIENCHFSNNTVERDAGGAMNLNVSGPILIDHCTIVSNFAGRACGAFWFGNKDLDITLRSSIVAFNTAGQDHAQDQIGYQPKDGGGNIEYPAPVGSGRRVAAGSLLTNPQLGALQNLDYMLTMTPEPGSPALGHAVPNAPPKIDIRGYTRDGSPDSGAVEREPTVNQ
ncbi:MAG: right-handed parallel beta-helix repeat-containing protein [Planctomycetota bacterium]|jgi:hypothetical protein|nr:right-handed parallel beta-helix repeat-containing protein [Planctomycetota bacterium]